MEFLSGGNLPTEAAEMASEVLQSCGSQEYMTLLCESFRAVGRQKREGAARLCLFYGELIVPLLMDALVEEGSQSGRRFLIGLTVNMGAKAVPEARKRLRDERWQVKRNAILILRGCGAEGLNEEIRPYCRHSDSRVSLEALRYLLSRGDEYGTGILREMFAAKSRGQVKVGVTLAGDFGLEEFLPDLTRLLRVRAKWRGDYDLKLTVVKALGQIGSRECMDGLRDVLALTSLFFRKDLKRVKTEAYRALGKIHSEGGQVEREEHGR
jgi:HEAT repeat protein